MNVFYRSSPDGGQSWNPEQMISSDDGYNSESPKIAVSEDGQSIHVIWVDSRNGAESFPTNTEIYYARSLDGGATWEPEVRLTNAWYSSTSIQIEAEGSDVHILWSDARFGVSSWDLFYKVSHDGGASWSADSMIASTPSTEGPCTIAASGSAVHAAWVDYSNPIYYLCYRNSTDNGDSWNPPVLLTGPSQMIVKPDISAEGGNVRVVWDDSRDGDIFKPEIYFKNSTDGGISWSPDLRLTHNLSGASQWPRIASTNNMNHVVWFDDRDGNNEIYYKRYPDFPTETINLTLTSGWNLISFPLDDPKIGGANITCAADLAAATGCTMLSRWNASGQLYVNYIPGFDLPTDPENFDIADDDAIFVWWNGTGNITFNVTGYEPGPQSVHLSPGWNTVGYNRLTMGNVSDWADQVSCGPYDDICYYDGITFIHYIFPGTEMYLVPTKGYFVWSDTEVWLCY